MILCSFSQITNMRICHYYQTCMVLNAQELILYCVCKQEKKQLHDILNIMTRSMSKAKQADIPAIYPLKGEHKKPEYVNPDEVKYKTGVEQAHPEQIEN